MQSQELGDGVDQSDQGLSSSDQEFQKRAALTDRAFTFFNGGRFAELYQGVQTTTEGSTRVAALDDLIRELHQNVSGIEPTEGFADVKVGHDVQSESEAFVEWQPPRPADEIYRQCLTEASALVSQGNAAEAAAVLFEGVSFIHPFPDGNGRTSRLLYFAIANPEYMQIKPFVDILMRGDLTRESSRLLSNQLLEQANGRLKNTLNLPPVLPYIQSDGVLSTYPHNQILRYAFALTVGDIQNSPGVVNLDTLPPDQKSRLDAVAADLRGRLVTDLLTDPGSRKVVNDHMTQTVVDLCT